VIDDPHVIGHHSRSVSPFAFSRCRVHWNDITPDLVSILLAEMRDAIAHLNNTPQSVPMIAEEAGGFNHL
jgi:hypothetical protein